jgi:molecular chaperone GrpE (heat shock protein)
MRKTGVIIVGLALLVGGGAVACGDDDASAEEQYCEALDGLEASIAELTALDPATASIDQIDEAREGIQSSLEDVDAAAEDVSADRVDDLDAAYDDLEGAVDDVSGDATVPEALEEITPEVQAVEQAFQAAFDEVDCAAVSGEDTTDTVE